MIKLKLHSYSHEHESFSIYLTNTAGHINIWELDYDDVQRMRRMLLEAENMIDRAREEKKSKK